MPFDERGVVGRTRELEMLAEHHAAVTAGAGRLVLVGGEAGIGKTRLVREFLDRIPAGTPRAIGEVVDLGDQEVPLLPIRLVVRELVDGRPELAAVLAELPGLARLVGGESGGRAPDPSDRSAEAPITEVLDLFASPHAAGAVIVVEDIHWADPTTLAALRLLATRLADLPILLVVTHRTELPRGHHLRAVLADLGRSPHSHRLEVGPFGPDDVAALHLAIRGVPPDRLTVDRLFGRAGGNPFFTTELIAAPDDDTLPAPLEDVLLHQIEQLPTAVLEVAHVVAAAGRIDHDDLGELIERPAEVVTDALRSAVDARIIAVDDDGGVRFRHALLAEATERTMLPFERRAIHQRLAERREAERAAGPTPADEAEWLARQARHWRLAGRIDRALPAALAAAEAALAEHADAVALAHLDIVLELWDAVPAAVALTGRHLGDVLVDASIAAVGTGRPEEAIRYARSAIDVAGDDACRVAAGALRLGVAEYAAGHLDQALATLSEHADRLLDEPPSREIVELGLTVVGASMTAGRYEDAARPDPRIVAMAERFGDPGAIARLAGYRGVALAALGDALAGVALVDEGIEMLTSAGLYDDAMTAILNRVIMGSRIDHVDTLDALAERGLRLAADHRVSPERAAGLTAVRADVLLRGGRLDDAERSLADMPVRFAWRTSLEITLARVAVLIERDDADAARRLLASPDVDGATAHPPTALRVPILTAHLHALDGDVDTAGRSLVAAVRAAGEISRFFHGAAALADAWTWADPGAGWYDELVEATRQLEREERPVPPDCQIAADRARVRAASTGGSADAWRAAIAVCAAAGCTIAELSATLSLATALVAAGERDAATAALDRVDASAERIGAHRLGRLAADLRRRARLGRAVTAEQAYGLTDRELDVLRLVVAGYSNGEIGDQLFISPKTVSVHLSNVFRKLEVPNRRAAARRAVELGLA